LENTRVPVCYPLPRTGERAWRDLTRNARNLNDQKTGAQNVPAEIWLAQSMGYVQIGQCYAMAHPVGLPMETAAGLQFHPVMITMTYFYNDYGPNPVEFDHAGVALNSADSIAVSIRQILAPQHITLAWDSTEGLLPAAWTGIGEGDSNKVFECYR